MGVSDYKGKLSLANLLFHHVMAFTMLLKKKFTDADHISVPNFWTSQYPEL
jgi:hypothetical protein